MKEIHEIGSAIDNILMLARQLQRQIEDSDERINDQSHALRELAHYLAENGVPVSRFTRRTQETMVAVALNGDY